MKPLIFSNLFIAAAATAFTHESYVLLGGEPHWALLVLVFSSTLVVYNLDRLSDASSEDEIDKTDRHRWIDEHRRFLLSMTGSAVCAGLLSLVFLPFDVIVALVPLGVVSLAYSLPVLWGRAGPYRLKDIAGLKIFLIAFVWSGATAALPAVELFDNPLQPAVVALLAERAVFIFALTLPFDVRDMERDRASEIWTIPLAIGVERTRRLALAVIGVFVAIVFVHYGFSLQGATVPLVASALVTFALVSNADENQSELYYVGQLDGMMALQWLFVVAWVWAA